MPIYEYICKKCSNKFSLLQRSGITEKDTVCPKCGSKDVKKSPSTFSRACSVDTGFSSGRLYPGFGGGG